MDELTSFLEHPLDKDLYVPKKQPFESKPPLRILVTEAGSRIAYNIIYGICSGNIFGPDQEIIFHLAAGASRNHKTVVLELQECGFPCFKDFVISSNPAVAFKKVNIVIAISTYEEMPGRLVTGAIVYQMIKARNLVRNIQDYAHKDCKLIFTGPSTKAATILLGTFNKFTKMPFENISCVTNLDAVITKAMLATKLKTTTDKIKNVVIWSATHTDLRNATVRMYPPDDRGPCEMKDIPVTEALQDEEWVYTTLTLAIYRRVMSPDLLSFGKAIALSTLHHLKVLFNGSDNFDEIFSMAVICPNTKPYGVPEGYGFAFPVRTENGIWKVLQNVPISVPTQLNIMRALFNLTHGVVVNSIIRIVSFMLEYEVSQKQMIRFCPKAVVDEVIESRPWTTKFFVTPSPAEGVEKVFRDTTSTSRKSIFWGDEVNSLKLKPEVKKSSIRFSSATFKDIKKSSFYSNEGDEVSSVFSKRGSTYNNDKFSGINFEKF